MDILSGFKWRMCLFVALSGNNGFDARTLRGGDVDESRVGAVKRHLDEPFEVWHARLFLVRSSEGGNQPC